MKPYRSLQLSFWFPGCVCALTRTGGGKGGARICSHPFLFGIPNISNQIKVAENTRDLSGLVGGGAGVRRLRPQGQRPAGSGPSEKHVQGHVYPLLFSLRILLVSGQGAAEVEVTHLLKGCGHPSTHGGIGSCQGEM